MPKLCCLLALLALFGQNQETPSIEGDNVTGFVFRVDGVFYESSVTNTEINEAGTSNPGSGTLKCSADEAARVAKASLRGILKNADEWTPYAITLQRHQVTDCWYWSVDFFSPSEKADTIDRESATIGVLMNGKTFLTSKFPVVRPVPQ